MYDYKVIDGHLTDVQYNGIGEFHCMQRGLISLEGCPKIVNGFFKCAYNKLTTLKGCPRETETFWGSHNELTTLTGGPEIVKGDFDCFKNKLTSLKGCPKVVTGVFYCGYNLNLEDISDIPADLTSIVAHKCFKIKVFPKHITTTLKLEVEKDVLKRLRQQKHLEILDVKHLSAEFYGESYKVLVREKPLGHQLLEDL